MNKSSIITVVVSIIVCLVVILALPTNVSVNVDDNVPADGGVSPAVVQTTLPPVTAAASVAATAQSVTAPLQQKVDENGAAVFTPTDMTKEEILDKYKMLVNKFKAERPAYKKKEFQALPEEYRQFGTAVNLILELASGYMVTEEECEELVRPAGTEDIRWDMPIHNSDVACVLTDYSCVEKASCTDMGNGLYEISFSLLEEANAEPTPGDTLIPVSNHGTVMQPVSRQEITTEVEKITSKVPGLDINQFDLYYRECVFECVYNPQTDEVVSITHHIVIDISADIKLFVTNIAGSARLLNEMLIYDITW